MGGRKRAPAPELFWASIVFFAALFLYTWTLAPTVTLVDSGELIVVAHSLGIAHPPGFPLWVMLAHLISLIPVGNVASRINFSSALSAALASAALSLIVADLSAASTMAAQRGRHIARGLGLGSHDRTVGPAGNRLLILGPMLTAGLLMASSRTLWSYATVTEVYALNTLLLLIIFFLMLRWRHQTMATRMSVTRAKASMSPITIHDSLLYTAAFLFGLALGVHHVTIALTLPALGLLVYRTEGLSFFKSRRFLYAALISTAAFAAVYTYLPLAAARVPLINWGEPFSAKAIWWHITGRQYQAFLSSSPSIIAEQFATLTKMLSREFGFAWLPFPMALALIGLASAFRRDRLLFWFLLLIVMGNLAYTLAYEIAEDKDAYCLPLFAAFVIAAGLGVRELIQFLLSRSLRPVNLALLVTVGSILIVSLTLVANWPFTNRRNNFIARDYVDNILSTTKTNGLLLTLDWQVASPFLYVQEIEGQRRDVKVLDINLLRHSWYFGYLKRAYPDLIERSQDKIDRYVADLKQWEQDPGAYTKDPILTARITSRFLDMIQTCVEREDKIGPVYITHELLTAERDVALTAWFSQNYALVPEGLVFRLAKDGSAFHEPGEFTWQTRGLNDGTLRFDAGDVVRNKVLPAYTSMLINRGRYLAAFGRHVRAITAFEQALVLDPDLETARQGLKESLDKSGQP